MTHDTETETQAGPEMKDKDEVWIGKGGNPVFRCADCDAVVKLYPGHRSTVYVNDQGHVEFAWCAKCAAQQTAAADVFRRRRRRT